MPTQLMNGKDEHTVTLQSPIHDLHAQFTPAFSKISGMLLPAGFGSLGAEHEAVRNRAGIFDVSYQCLVEIKGSGAEHWLRELLSNDVARLSDGQGMHSCLCRDDAGVIDCFLVTRINSTHYRVLLDQERLKKVLDWFARHPASQVQISVNDRHATLAVQGPDAANLSQAALKEMGLSLDLLALESLESIDTGNWFISRSGQSGEDGLQFNLPSEPAKQLWQTLTDLQVVSAGMEVYETLRIEAGLPAYGNEIDEQHSPVEAGLADSIDISDDNREFIGKELLEDHKLFGGRSWQIGLMLDMKCDITPGLSVELVGKSIGKITSATFSPTHGEFVALARVDKRFKGGCDINLQGRLVPAHIVSLPFVPHGLAR